MSRDCVAGDQVDSTESGQRRDTGKSGLVVMVDWAAVNGEGDLKQVN
jgi:hypothetical protein